MLPDTYPENNFANYKVMGAIHRVTMNTDEYYRIYDELERADNGSRVYMQVMTEHNYIVIVLESQLGTEATSSLQRATLSALYISG